MPVARHRPGAFRRLEVGMNYLASCIRLIGLRRRAGASLGASLRWAAGVLLRDYRIDKRRQHLERRARQRL